jgi:hypothetical protein
MTAILSANRDALARLPDLVGALASLPVTRAVHVERGPEGQAWARIVAEGRTATLCSSRRPDRDAARMAERVSAGAAACLVVGFGVGHLPRAVLARVGDRARVHVAVMNPDLFLAVLRETDVADVLADPRLRLIAGDDSTVVRGVLDVLRDEPALEVVVDRAALRASATVAPSAWELGERLIEGEEVQGGRADAIRGNYVANLPAVLRWPGIASLRARYRGLPGVIVSAGPSLDGNRQHLPALRGRALVLCVEAAYPAFRAVGAVPDLLVSVDDSEFNCAHFTLIDAPVPLVVMPSVHPDIPRVHAGPKLVALPRGDRLAEYLARETGGTVVESGASVTNAAVGVADALGLDPVILVGLDLSYPPTGASHTEGARWRRNTGIADHAYAVEVPAALGGTVRTLPNFARYLRWLERFIASHPGTRYVDATEGGARKAGAEVLPLTETVARYGADVPAPPPIAARPLPDEAARAAVVARMLASFPELVPILEQRWGTADPYRLPSTYWDAESLSER